MSLSGAKRISVYGVTGSGKTTLAKRLSEVAGIPWHSIDDLMWEPSWEEVPEAEQRSRVEAITRESEWILDTMYGKWLDVELPRVELVVGLDFPRWVSFGRLLRRTLNRVMDKHPICNGNTENWRQMLSRDSILVWHFRSFAGKRRRLREWEIREDGPKVLRFRSSREVERWLEELRHESDTNPTA